MSARDDDYLMLRVAIGDKAALGELSKRYRSGVVGYFTRRSRSVDAAYLASIVFDKVARKAPSYVARGKFDRWLDAIAKNVLRDELRRGKRERERQGLWHVTKHGSMGSQGSSEGASEIVDVSFHTRGVDVSVRLSPGELQRKGYSLSSEIRRIFRPLGLVDGPTPGIWQKSYKNMKINNSESAFGGVIPAKRDYPISNGASHPLATAQPPPMEIIQNNGIATC